MACALALGCAGAGSRTRSAPATVLALRLRVSPEVGVGSATPPAQAGRLASALEAALRAEGFADASAGADAVVRLSVDFAEATAATEAGLFVAAVVERDGAQVDEVSLQQAREGFPESDERARALVLPLVQKLERSPRLRALAEELLLLRGGVGGGQSSRQILRQHRFEVGALH